MRILRLSERCECFGSDHPGRYSGPKVLGQEWAQRLVLPTLDVARGPIVEEAEPRYMLIGLADRNRLTESIARSDPDPEFKLVVESAARTECWSGRLWVLQLARGMSHRCAG